MLKKKIVLSKNIKDTAKIARLFLEEIKGKNTENREALVISLSGDLGAGKTAFTQAVAKQLGIKNRLNSPTFVIMKNYKLRNTKFKKLFHLDAYRLKNEQELLGLGWAEIIQNKEHLVFIEWPENVLKAIPKSAKKIHISHTKEGYRNFKFK